MIEGLLQRWRALAERERRLLGLCAVVVCAAASYLLLIEPAWVGRERIAAQLPGLREQVAQIDLLSAEARSLSAAATPRGSMQSIRLRVDQSIDSAGLRGALQQIQSNDSLIDLRFRGTAFAGWLVWLDGLLRETRLRVSDLAVTRDTEAGLVSIRVVLELPGSAGR